MFRNFLSRLVPHKKLIQNFGYLSALQIFNLILPLLTYPYLIRILGKEVYGLIVFAQAVIIYFTILTNYGFSISAVKEVSIHRAEKNKLSDIFSCVTIIKTFLLAVSIFILYSVLFFIPQAQDYKTLFFLSMWICIYDILFPSWYFQGIEEMKYITYLTLIGRVFFASLIFIFVKDKSDYLLVPIINGVGAIITGLFSLYIIIIKHKVRFIIPDFKSVKYYFKDSTPIFLSNLSVRIYVSTNKVLVGSFLGMADVAYYDLAEKINTILRSPLSILSQSLFPKISKDRDKYFVKKIFKISVLVNIVLFIVILLTSNYIVLWLGGEEMLDAVIVVNLLAITLPLLAMNNVFGVQLLLTFGYNKLFSKGIILSGLFYASLALIIWGLFDFNILNITLMTVITEVFVTIYMYYNVKKLDLWV